MGTSMKMLFDLIFNATQALECEGLQSPDNFEKIEAAFGCFAGPGLRVVNARNPVTAREIAGILLPMSAQLPLVYFTERPKGIEVFCGRMYEDERSFERLTNQFAEELDEEPQEVSFGLRDGEHLALETELRELAREVLGEEAENLEFDFVPSDNQLVSICLRNLPDERPAAELQRALLRSLPKHAFFARFPWEEYWNIFCQEAAPIA